MAFERGSAAATAGVAGLAVIAVGLSYLALTTTSTASPAGPSTVRSAVGITPTAPARHTVSPPPHPSASSSAERASSSPIAAGFEPALSVGSADSAWRASGGDCSTGAPSTIERTSDGGRHWTKAASANLQVVAVRATSALSATAVGLDDSCASRVVATTDGGATWSPSTATPVIWSATRDGVLPPGGQASTACDTSRVVSVAGTSKRNGYVLCSDGTVRATTDAGATYLTQSTLPGAAALAVAGDGVLYAAVVGDATCTGVLVSASGDDGASWNPVRCVAEATTGSRVALAASGPVTMLVRGTAVFRSTDSAVTWVRVAA